MFNNHSLLKIITWAWFVSQSYFHDINSITIVYFKQSTRTYHSFRSLGIIVTRWSSWQILSEVLSLSSNVPKADSELQLVFCYWWPGEPCRQQLCPAEQHSPWAEATRKPSGGQWSRKKHDLASSWEAQRTPLIPRNAWHRRQTLWGLWEQAEAETIYLSYHFWIYRLLRKRLPLQLVTHNWETITKM